MMWDAVLELLTLRRKERGRGYLLVAIQRVARERRQETRVLDIRTSKQPHPLQLLARLEMLGRPRSSRWLPRHAAMLRSGAAPRAAHGATRCGSARCEQPHLQSYSFTEIRRRVRLARALVDLACLDNPLEDNAATAKRGRVSPPSDDSSSSGAGSSSSSMALSSARPHPAKRGGGMRRGFLLGPPVEEERGCEPYVPFVEVGWWGGDT